jgi:hypothetical protein
MWLFLSTLMDHIICEGKNKSSGSLALLHAVFFFVTKHMHKIIIFKFYSSFSNMFSYLLDHITNNEAYFFSVKRSL